MVGTIYELSESHLPTLGPRLHPGLVADNISCIAEVRLSRQFNRIKNHFEKQSLVYVDTT